MRFLVTLVQNLVIVATVILIVLVIHKLVSAAMVIVFALVVQDPTDSRAHSTEDVTTHQNCAINLAQNANISIVTKDDDRLQVKNWVLITLLNLFTGTESMIIIAKVITNARRTWRASVENVTHVKHFEDYLIINGDHFPPVVLDLRPGDYNCKYDEQCNRSCPFSVCVSEPLANLTMCRCESGRYEFAHKCCTFIRTILNHLNISYILFCRERMP